MDLTSFLGWLKVHQKMRKFERMRDFLLQMLFLLIVVSLIVWAGAKFGGHYSSKINIHSPIKGDKIPNPTTIKA